jgi:hypothetical protein
MTSHFESDESGGSALMPIENDVFMPILSIQQAVERFNAVVEFVRTVMREGVDYGRIPGTEKATLLKPGAEKLCTLFGLMSRFEIIRSIEDWTGESHNGEPFFYYLYRCRLQRGSLVIAEGDGSCNSWEQKYRYRQAHRRCPACGQPAIIQGKEEYGGGWVCFRKRGGCGAKFAIDDDSITSQPAGRVANENIADQVNTIQKIAQKRALIAAALLAVNGSEFFTQDSEDFFSVEAEAPPPVLSFSERVAKEDWRCTPAQRQMALNLLAQLTATGKSEEDVLLLLANEFSVESPALLAQSAVPRFINRLKELLKK